MDVVSRHHPLISLHVSVLSQTLMLMQLLLPAEEEVILCHEIQVIPIPSFQENLAVEVEESVMVGIYCRYLSRGYLHINLHSA